MEMLGYTREEYLGRHIAEFHADREVIEEILRRLRRGERLREFEARLKRKDGSICHVMIASSVLWENGRFVHTQCFTRDVTRQKATGDALRRRINQLQAVYELSATVERAASLETIYNAAIACLKRALAADRASILCFDDSGVMRFTAWSGLSEGYRRAVEGHSPWPRDAANPEPIAISDVASAPGLDAFRPIILGEGIHALAFIPLTHQGTLLGKFMLYYDQPRDLDADDLSLARTIASHVAFALDRHKAGEHRRLYREIFAGSKDAIGIIHPDGTYIEQNAAHHALIGYSEAELRGKTPEIHLGPCFETVVCALKTEGRFRGEVVSRAKDGTEINVDLSAFTVKDENGRVLCHVGIKRDITERKRAEAALRQSEALFRELADAMPQMVWAARADGHVDYYNRRWYIYTGFGPGSGDASWLPVLYPEDSQRIFRSWYEAVRSGRPYEAECRFKDRQTGGHRWFLVRALPIRSDAGEIIRWFGTCTDIDDQKRAEEKLEQAVAERTASLRDAIAQMEEFSYSVSHDLRGPLRAMQGYCHILLEDAAGELSGEHLSFLKRVANSAERLDRLVQDVLAFTRVSRVDMQMAPVEMDQTISDVLRNYAGEHRPVPEVAVQRPLLNVLGHEPSLVQCVSNLIGNALKFVAPGTAPRLRIWTESREKQVRLWIEDNGIGIPADQADRIFQIFERLPDASGYPGTGVGLAIVKKAIHRMRGEVGVESDPGCGSRFWIQLPAAV